MIKIKRIQDVQFINGIMKDASMYAQHLSTTALFEQCDCDAFNIWAGLMDLSHSIYACEYENLADKMESILLDLSQKIDYSKTIHEDRLCIRNIIMMLYRLNDFLLALPQE